MAKGKLQNSFIKGFKDGIPVILGYLSVSFAFGMSICKNGFPVWLGGLISFTNLTSAGQFAGTSLMLEGAGYAEIALTTAIINLRYFLMSLSLSQKLDGHFTLPRRLITAHAITDEIFAIAIGRKGLVTPDYILGLLIGPLLAWTSGTVLGGIFSQVLPVDIVNAINISLYAMFLAIVIPPARDSKPLMITVIAAIVLNCIFEYVPFFEFLSGGWSIIVIAVVVGAFMAWKFPIEISDEEENAGRPEWVDGAPIEDKEAKL